MVERESLNQEVAGSNPVAPRLSLSWLEILIVDTFVDDTIKSQATRNLRVFFSARDTQDHFTLVHSVAHLGEGVR